SQQVGDLLCYLRALANPLDELALYGTLASPLVGLSSDALALLARAARARGSGQVWAAVQGAEEQLIDRLPSGDRRALATFRDRFRGGGAGRGAGPDSQLARGGGGGGFLPGARAGAGWGRAAAGEGAQAAAPGPPLRGSEGRDVRGFLDLADQLREAGNGAEP